MLHDVIPSSMISYYPESGAFIEDKSTLDHAGFNLFKQVSEDAAGFGIKSEKSGYTALFYLASVSENADREITQWHFKPLNKTLLAKGIEVHILNT